MTIYLIIAYLLLAGTCIMGAFSRAFNGDSMQRLALGVLFFWFAGRAYMLITMPYGWPHEPGIVTGLLLYASGTVKKTVKYCIRRKRAAQLIRIRRDDNVRTI